MMRIYLFFLLSIIYYLAVKAQGFDYDSKIDIGNNLYKVKSGQFFGIIDDKDNVVVSVEYQDILFRQGKALLTKNNILCGIVDSLGHVKTFDPKFKVHPVFRYVYDGYIIVGSSKWGYISEYGVPLLFNKKIKGSLIYLPKKFMIFDEVYPFVDGIAVVYHKKKGWRHIDINGKEHFIIDKKVKSLFRSSVYKDECIIVTNEGIKQYQERINNQAVVKRVLSTPILGKYNITMNRIFQNNSDEGTLVVDSLMRVSKYVTKNDSIIFIEKPKPVIIETPQIPSIIDTISIKGHVRAEVISTNVSANERGKAKIEVKISNKSNFKFENLTILIECGSSSRNWIGTLAGNENLRLPISIPAVFSKPQQKRMVKVIIKDKYEEIQYKLPITIKRYTPKRSR